MTTLDFIQIIMYFALLIGLTPVLGNYMSRVFNGQKHFMSPVFGWLERGIYKISGVNPEEETNWKTYTYSLLAFNAIGLLFVFLMQVSQSFLPLNPAQMPNVSWHSAINTAISFVTNTNWQGYSGETTMSYLVQMMGLSVQNFVSAATGIAVLLALIKGLSRRSSATIGNFWTDLDPINNLCAFATGNLVFHCFGWSGCDPKFSFIPNGSYVAGSRAGTSNGAGGLANCD